MKKPKKIISFLALIFFAMFLTVGIPQNIIEPTWYSIWCIKGNKAILISIGSLVVTFAIIAQIRNEWNRPKGGKNVN